MSLNQSRLKLFCADNSPVLPSSLIFDNTYKNMNQKRKFQHDPKFAYYNTLTKMKNNYIHTNKSVYQHIFKLEGQKKNQDITNISQFSRQMNTRSYEQKQIFHVQKINNHAFKIYKNKRNQVNSLRKFSNNQQSINDINFQVHFKGKSRFEQQKQKPKIQLLLSQYKKLQEFKNRINPQRMSVTKYKKVSIKNNTKYQTKNFSSDRNIFSSSQATRFLKTAGKDKNRANMSQLALRISG